MEVQIKEEHNTLISTIGQNGKTDIEKQWNNI